MIIKKQVRLILFLIIILTATVPGCKKEDNSPVYSYYVSKELKLSYSQNYINGLINTASISLPDLNSLKPYVQSDVKVYRMVYKTTINGSETKVSGLVCVPSTPGEYPVLSFQNGTNTLNANAPSEFVANYSYQMIEVLASMGYIVAFADYPGFGESSQIPHPYLVAEPTVRSLVDMLYAVKELSKNELDGISVKDEYYLLGYSQGGWATLELAKAMELNYSTDFNLKGSACGAGPYNIYLLMQGMVSIDTYPMPAYIGYILNAYTSYNQFSNPVTDILNEPYASRLNSLYDGNHTADEINSQLTTSVHDLINPDFLAGFVTSERYASVREAFNNNSITGWRTNIPLLLVHGENDKTVNPVSTENMYSSMIQAGTSADICKKVIIPGVDHSDGAAPFIIQGILFLKSLSNSKR